MLQITQEKKKKNPPLHQTPHTSIAIYLFEATKDIFHEFEATTNSLSTAWTVGRK